MVNRTEGARRGPRESGSALVVILLALLTLSVVGTAMVFTSEISHLEAANERDAERALLASRAGLHFGYQLYIDGTTAPTAAGTAFDSTTAGVDGPLDGARFSGLFFDDAAAAGTGQLYRIRSTGTFNRARRTTELVFKIVPEAFRFGYAAFNRAQLDNHSGLAGPTFKIESTVFSNDTVQIPDEITLDGSIVAAGEVEINDNATVKGDVFANEVKFAGSGQTVEGDVTLLTAVADLPSSAGSWDRVDVHGNKYDWWAGLSTPGTVSGSGTILGTQSSYTIQDGDIFRNSIFRRDGKQLADPNVNVVKFASPPKLDYVGMKLEADANDATYFASMTDAMNYLVSKKIVEVIDGKTLTTIRVGTTAAPELLYVDDDFTLELKPSAGSDSPSSGVLAADGFHLEGGIYVSGDFEFNGPTFDPLLHPSPPDYYQLKISALPYCFPAIVAYPEPGSGTFATWTANDTPAMTGGASKMKISSSVSPHEGFVYVHGVVYGEGEIHLHHTKSTNELIRFIGAELAYKIHNCDYFWFTYDPDVVCTRFLVADAGSPQLVSFREIR